MVNKRKMRLIRSIKRGLIFIITLFMLLFISTLVYTLVNKNNKSKCGKLIDIGHGRGSEYWIVLKEDNYERIDISIYDYLILKSKRGKNVCIEGN